MSTENIQQPASVNEAEDTAGFAATHGSAKQPPNKINRSISEEDRRNAKGQSAASLAEECLEHLERGCPYHTTFVRSIPLDCQQAAERELHAAFELWANSWLAPKLRRIIAKASPNND